MVAATEAFKVHWNLSQSEAHTQRIHLSEARSTYSVSNEVWFCWFPSPSFGFPSHSFPLDIPSFPPSFHIFLSSCSVISSLSFFCAHTAQPLVCTCTTYFNLGFRSPGLYNEVGFHRLSLCAWFPFIATTYTFVASCPLFMPSLFCLAGRTLAHSPWP